METDASNLVVSGVLSQYYDNIVLHSEAYFSRKHSPAKMNYEIINKEFLTTI
jgi:hypothetical protein